jgi:hypothetical protein
MATELACAGALRPSVDLRKVWHKRINGRLCFPESLIEMTVYGYGRFSTDGQTLVAQDAALHAAGCAKVYSEKQSGAKTDRTERRTADAVCTVGLRRGHRRAIGTR